MNRFNSINMKMIISLLLSLSGPLLHAQSSATKASEGFQLNIDINILLAVFAVFLVFPLWLLGNIFITAAKKHYGDLRRTGQLKVVLPLLLVFSATIAHAATPTSAEGVNSTNLTVGLLLVILLELALMIFFALRINEFLKPAEHKMSKVTERLDIFDKVSRLWTKANFVPMEEEEKLDLQHNYDGIRELDNVIPPWFTTAFALTILFAIGYLYRYHIAKSAPMQVQEYKMAVAKADAEHEAFLAKQANSIDENSITVMTGADLDAGKHTFTTLCAVCHRADGGGMVGPNLTDPYWIHGGALKDVFKTIKYGVPEKGMISWKTQLSPLQMAQVANYVLTLQGTNPADPKEKQGTLYTPETEASDTTATAVPAADTTKVQQ